MARQKRQLARQGAAADLPDRASVLAYVGANGEPIFDGDTLRMMNGITPGGIVLLTQPLLLAAIQAIVPTLPTSLPAAAGVLWNNGGILSIS